jgi:hypothetical protein
MTITLLAAIPPVSPAQIATTTTSTTSTTTTTSTTSTTTTLPVDADCGVWWSLATQVGFTPEMLPTLDRVIWRESRCDTTQHNAQDPNGGSHGLTQINGFWCQPSKYYPLGYLQTFDVLTDCDDLYTPKVNLHAAYVLTVYSRSVGLCAWAQWAWYEGCED